MRHSLHKTEAGKSPLLWLALAFFGIPLWIATKVLRHELGCPWSGDCYLPGWGILRTLEDVFVIWLVFLFPLSVFRIIRARIR